MVPLDMTYHTDEFLSCFFLTSLAINRYRDTAAIFTEVSGFISLMGG